MKLQLTDITIKQGRRAVDESKVRELAQSMSEVGLINPITITQDKTLITGAHRLAAAKLLGWTEIEATVSELEGIWAGLAEIDENLMRNDLHYIDRGQAFKRRDELLEEAGRRARRGDNRYTMDRPAESASLKQTEEIAAELGVSGRTMRVEKQIARDILPEAQEAIKAADLPKTDALKIARMEPEKQVEAVKQMAAKPPVIRKPGRPKIQTPAKDLTEKECTTCGLIRPIDKFYFSQGRYSSSCKQCEQMKKTYGISSTIRENIGGIQETVNYMTDTERVMEYSIEDVIVPIQEEVARLIRVIDAETKNHSDLLENPGNKAALLQALETGVNQIQNKIQDLAR